MNSYSSVSLPSGCIAVLCAVVASAAPLQVGSERQLFVDRTFLAEARDVTLEVHSPRKSGEQTVRADRRWERGGIGPYSSVLHDGTTYHMWYHAMDSAQWDTGHRNGSICYAT